MKILVLGGTGTVGSAVVRELLARDAEVRVLTRDAATAQVPDGVELAEGNLQEPETIRSVFRGMDGAFVINTVTPAETHEGLMAVNGADLAGTERVVYLSVHHADAAPHLPHFGGKLAIEEAVKRLDAAWTILRPNNFHQNDHWFKDSILGEGIYPQPLGPTGVSRVDVRDIAEAAAIALTTGEHGGETYDLVGPDAVTGEGTAQTWSRVLEREVRYGGDDMDAWERSALAWLPDWLAFDYRRMYEHFQRHGLIASEEAIARQTALLGHPPRSFEAFARETAEAWRG